jgi:hypothetical protein
VNAFVATCAVDDRRQGACGAPTQGFLCSKHRDELVMWLWDIGGVSLGDSGQYQPSLLDDLDVTICGVDKVGGASIGVVVRSSDTPLAFNEKASDIKRAVINAVQSWARVFAEENPHLIFDPATIEEAARWMAGFPNLLAGHPAAVEMYRDLGDLTFRARRSIDRPARRVYAGVCGAVLNRVACTEQLFAWEGRYEVVCPICGTEHLVEDRQRQILLGLRACTATARQITDALKAWTGIGINVKSVRTWARRGLLTNYAPEGETPVHQIGQTLDLARSVRATSEPSCTEAA